MMGYARERMERDVQQTGILRWWPNMQDDECSLCGCNGSACSGCPMCDPREEPAYTDAEIDQIEIAHRLMRR